MTASAAKPPLRLFICHDLSDERYLQQLQRHLAPLVSAGLLAISDATQVTPGITNGATAAIAAADVVILLLSAALVSEHPALVEHAMAQRARGALVVPVLLRPLAVEQALGSTVSSLPTNGRPVTRWRNIDAAWQSVVESLAKQLKSRTEPPLTSQTSRWPLRRRLALGLPLLALLATLLGLGISYVRGPQFPTQSGGLLVRGQLPSALASGSAFRRICDRARARAPGHVDCSLFLGMTQALRSGATLVLDVPTDQRVSLLAQPGRPVTVPLGAINLPADAAAIEQLVAVALQLSLWFVPGTAPQAQPVIEIAALSPQAIGEELALLSAFVRWRQRAGTLSDTASPIGERVFLHAVSSQCEERPQPPWQCQLARFLFAVDCPGCPGATAALARLSDENGPLRDLALLQRAEASCKSDPPQAATLLQQVGLHQPCDQLSLGTVAACALGSGGARLPEPVVAKLRGWAQLDPRTVPGCPRTQVSAALGWRGIYAALSGSWDRALPDFAAAYAVQPRSVWLLMHAEAALHLGQPELARELLRPEALRIVSAPRHRILAHFLQHLAQPGTGPSLRFLLSEYEPLAVQTVVLDDEGQTLRRLACRDPLALACRVYAVLVTPKQATSTTELKQLIVPTAP